MAVPGDQNALLQGLLFLFIERKIMKRSTWITWSVVALFAIAAISTPSNSSEDNGAALIVNLAVMTGVVWGISLLIQWIYLKVRSANGS
jgi:hypothetical protein